MNTNIIQLRNVSKSFADHPVLQELNLKVKNGEFLTLVGPSGCGKTTLLRLLSGFEEPTAGTITIGGRNAAGLEPQLRDVHTVFQSYALFPHMSVFENVAFALRCKNLSAEEIETRVHDALRMVKLEHLTQRKPSMLSGGQQQRIAIARAIINRPLVVLLDEPFSALDYGLRKATRIELKQLQRQLGITFILVTHDQEEALSLSDRVVVMIDGRIEQIGSPREVYEEPKNLPVAKFIGETNIFSTSIINATKKSIDVSIENVSFTLKNTRNFNASDNVHIIVRPEDLRVKAEADVDDSRNMLPGAIEEVIYKGSTVDLVVRLDSGMQLSATEFFDEDDEDLQYTLKEKVWVHWIPGWEVILPQVEATLI